MYKSSFYTHKQFYDHRNIIKTFDAYAVRSYFSANGLIVYYKVRPTQKVFIVIYGDGGGHDLYLPHSTAQSDGTSDLIQTLNVYFESEA